MAPLLQHARGVLTSFVRIETVSRVMFPELSSQFDRSLMLTAIALSDNKGRFGMNDLAQHLGLPLVTALRFVHAFEDLGLMHMEGQDSARVSERVMDRVNTRIDQAFVKTLISSIT